MAKKNSGTEDIAATVADEMNQAGFQTTMQDGVVVISARRGWKEKIGGLFRGRLTKSKIATDQAPRKQGMLTDAEKQGVTPSSQTVDLRPLIALAFLGPLVLIFIAGKIFVG